MKTELLQSQIINYLKEEKDLYKADIARNRNLSDEEKIDEGLLIKDAVIDEVKGNEYVFSTSHNYTKLRPGDSVSVIKTSSKAIYSSTVIDNGTEFIILKCSDTLNTDSYYDIEVKEFVLLDPLIKLMESIKPGAPGMGLLKVMAGDSKPRAKGLFQRITVDERNIPSSMNEAQRKAIADIFNKPSLYCLQGPPGTGKTFVLAYIASQFSKNGQEVMILAKTHQAVNNALNKVHNINKDSYVVKIGEQLKGMDLHDDIICATTYNQYIKFRNTTRRNNVYKDIVGMTMQAGVVNLGLRNQGFKPQVILIDEASQIPMTEAAWLGACGAGTIVFIGDEQQMPPIFHPEQKNDGLSISMFEFLHNSFPDLFSSLNVTFRMNEEITSCVSRSFYESCGIQLRSDDTAKNRKFMITTETEDEHINKILNYGTSIMLMNVTKEPKWKDENEEEAEFIARLVKHATQCPNKNESIAIEEIAVITPFRRQVRMIRQKCTSLVGEEIPLIDTVERLQGQDVTMIIISMCVSDKKYYNEIKTFLLNKNRLNVMLSRAKAKVVLLADDIMQNDLNELIIK